MPYSKPCRCPDLVTMTQPVSANHLLNFLTVGVPTVLAPEELNPIDFGQSLSPVIQPNVNYQKLTYKTDPTWDMYVDAITCAVYNVNPSTFVLTPVVPDSLAGIDPADIRLEFYDGAAERIWQNEPIHWQEVAGTGGLLYSFYTPLFLAAGNTYSLHVYNREAESYYMLCLYLHGRRVRARKTRDGMMLPGPQVIEEKLRNHQRKTGKDKRLRYLIGDNDCNKRDLGVPHYKSLHDGPLVVPASEDVASPLANPGRLVAEFNVDAETNFYVREIFGWQRRDAGLGFPNTVNTLINEPIFVRAYDERSEYFLSNKFVLMQSICGNGQFPYVLRQDWVWPQGSSITVEFLNPTADDIQIHWTFSGWVRTAGEC